MMIEARRTSESAKSAPEETRERILQATREVIARKGKRGATTREIADVAGVNEATLFRHFGSKEALMVACVQKFCLSEELRDVASQLNGRIEDDLLTVGSLMLDRMEAMQDMIRWSLVEQDYEADLFAAYAWRPQLAVHEVILGFLERRIDAGELRGDAKKLATVFMGMIFAYVMGRKKFTDAELHSDPGAALRLFIDVFLNGVRK